MHQHAEAGYPHLGSVIIQAYNSVEVKALRLISEAAYPRPAFPSPPLLYGLYVTNVCCLHTEASFQSAEMKMYSKQTSPTSCAPPPNRICLHVNASHAGREVHSGGLMKFSRAAKQGKGYQGCTSYGRCTYTLTHKHPPQMPSPPVS